MLVFSPKGTGPKGDNAVARRSASPETDAHVCRCIAVRLRLGEAVKDKLCN